MQKLIARWVRALYTDSVRGAVFADGGDIDAIVALLPETKDADVVALPVSEPVTTRRAA